MPYFILLSSGQHPKNGNEAERFSTLFRLILKIFYPLRKPGRNTSAYRFLLSTRQKDPMIVKGTTNKERCFLCALAGQLGGAMHGSLNLLLLVVSKQNVNKLEPEKLLLSRKNGS